MCMVNPISSKAPPSTGMVAIMAPRPTSRPSTANQGPIAPLVVSTTQSQLSHKTTHPRHPRHCPATNPEHLSGQSRVCPGPSRPGLSRIHAIDVNAEPPTAFHAYSPNSINEKVVCDNSGANSIKDQNSKDGSKCSSQDLHLPIPVTTNKTYRSTKPYGSVARARIILIVALIILCMYYYPLALSLPYIIYARYNISHSG